MNLQKSYILALLIFSSLYLIPIQLCVAETPEYVGFEEDQEFVWDINFDKELAEDVIEDYFDSIYGGNYYEDEFDDAIELTIEDHNDISIAGDEEKWYKVDVTSDKNLTVKIFYDDTDDIDLELYNKDGSYIGYYDSYYSGSIEWESRLVLTTYSGYYYFQVENWDSTSTTFSLSISSSSWNNEDIFSSASTYGPYSLTTENQDQVFKITDVPENKNLSVSILYDTDVYDVDLRLFDQDLDYLDYADEFSGGSIAWEITSYTGDYYFIVEQDWNYPSYNIEIEISDPSESGSSSSYISPADLFIDILDEYDDVKGLKMTIDDIDEEDGEIVDFCVIDASVEYSVDMVEWNDLEDEYEDYYEDEFGSTAPDLSNIYQILIPDPDDIDEDNYYGLLSGYLFSPVGLDWEDIADYVDDDYQDSELDFEAETNGFTATADLMGNMDEFEITVQYDAQGVLQYMQVLYGGIEVGTIRSNFLSAIITISIIAVVAGVAVIGLVVLYMKRKSKF